MPTLLSLPSSLYVQQNEASESEGNRAGLQSCPLTGQGGRHTLPDTAIQRYPQVLVRPTDRKGVGSRYGLRETVIVDRHRTSEPGSPSVWQESREEVAQSQASRMGAPAVGGSVVKWKMLKSGSAIQRFHWLHGFRTRKTRAAVMRQRQPLIQVMMQLPAAPPQRVRRHRGHVCHRDPPVQPRP